jgi:hypothetical protein
VERKVGRAHCRETRPPPSTVIQSRAAGIVASLQTNGFFALKNGNPEKAVTAAAAAAIKLDFEEEKKEDDLIKDTAGDEKKGDGSTQVADDAPVSHATINADACVKPKNPCTRRMQQRITLTLWFPLQHQ